MEPHPALSVLIALVITVLAASFLFSVGNAVFVEPEYDEYCSIMPYPDRFENLTNAEREEHDRQWRECQHAFQNARDEHRNAVFFTVTILAVLVIIGALALRPDKVDLTFYIVSGVVFGSLAAILVSTMQNWASFGRLLRPLVLFIEIVLVTFVAYRLFASKEHKAKRRDTK
ncbi:MAG: hypothetical protein ACMXYM_00250 [Candidatus Woesearchaeota archaeon]